MLFLYCFVLCAAHTDYLSLDVYGLASDGCAEVIVLVQSTHGIIDLLSIVLLLWLMFALCLLGVENKEDKMLLPDPRPGAVS